VAAVLRQFGASYVAVNGGRMPARQLKAMRSIELCQTAALGGHVVECTGCRVQDYVFHSCQHRSCPRCMKGQKEKWLEARRGEFLPVPYFHIVFSVPKALHGLIRTHARTLYPLLIRAAAHAVLEVGGAPQHLGGTLGVMATLHTSTRTLMYYPHVHCLVPAGSVDAQGQWHAATRPQLAPGKALADAFRTKLGALMVDAVEGLQLLGSVPRSSWEVYVDQPEHGAETVLRYLADSLYRGALSDYHILDVTDTHVVFKYRDRDRRKWRTMQVNGHEFLRRLLQHVWPERIHKVRYFGLWSRKFRPQLEALRQELVTAASAVAPVPMTSPPNPASVPHCDPDLPHWLQCPHCSGRRIIISRFARGTRPPPLRTARPAAPPPTPPPGPP
jgi:hypothetical protein